MTDIAFTITGKDRTGAAFKSVESNLAKTQKSIKNFGSAFQAAIGALAIRQMTRFVTSQIALADTIAKAADVAGIAASELQELRFAFGQLAKVTDSEVDLSLQQFSRSLGLAIDQGGPAKETFRALGIAIKDAAGAVRPTSAVLDEVLRTLALIPNDATRAARSAEFFGSRAGPKLAAALGEGIGQVDALRKAINDDGGIIPDDAIAKAEELNDKFDKIKRIIDAKFVSTVIENAAAIDTLAKATATLVGWTTAAAGSVATFTKWVGDELAAAIHGVSVDDIPRLMQKLADLSRQLDLVSSGRNRSPSRMTALREEIAQTEALIANAQRRASAPKIEPAATVDSRDPNFGQLPPKPVKVPVIKPTVTFSTNAAEMMADKAKEAQRIFDSLRTETEQIEAQIRRVQELAAEGFFSGGQDTELLDRLNAQLDAIGEKAEIAGSEISTAIQANIGGALDEMFASGSLSADAFFEAVIRDLLRVAVQLMVIKPLMEGLFGASAGGTGGGWVGAIAGAMGFAKGGQFTVGGSGGPDSQFVPLRLSPGEHVAITPQGKMGAGVSMITNIDARGADPSTIAAFNRSLALRDRKIKAEVSDMSRRGRL